MTTNNADLADALCAMLASVGYTFHDNVDDAPEMLDDDEPRGHWFAWAAPGMDDCETGESHSEFAGAAREAMGHWFAFARIPLATVDQVVPDHPERLSSVALMSFDLQRVVEQLEAGHEDDAAGAIRSTIARHPLPTGSLAAAAQTFRDALVECVAGAPSQEPDVEYGDTEEAFNRGLSFGAWQAVAPARQALALRLLALEQRS